MASSIFPETLLSKTEARWHTDYKGRELHFIRDILGLKHPRTGALQMWAFPRHMIRALFKYRRVAVASSRSTSKTHSLGHLIPAFLYTEPSRVIVVGPTLRQITKGAMGEARSAMNKSPRPLHTASGRAGESEIKIDERHFAIALPAKNPEAMRGFHASPRVPGDPDADALSLEDVEYFEELASDGSSRILIIIDEAPGVDPEAYRALAGMATKPNVYQLWTGNPFAGADDDHPFVQAFHEGSRFHRIRVSSLPAEDFPPPPGIIFDVTFDHVPEWLVSPDDIQGALRSYSKNDPILLSDWAGVFSSGSTEFNVVPRTALEAALSSSATMRRPLGPRIGVDIGSGNPDPCVASLFVDGVKRSEHVWAPPADSSEGQVLTADTIMALAARWGEALAEDEGEAWSEGAIPGERISIDDSGMVGVCDILGSRGMLVDRVNFARGAAGQWRDLVGVQRFKNLRAEMYWVARRGLQEGVFMIPRQWEDSWRQLTWARFTRTFDSIGPIVQLEPKEEIVKRHGRSPDVADADVLAMRETHGRGRAHGAGGPVQTPVAPDGRFRPGAQPVVGGRKRPTRLPGAMRGR